MNAFIYAIVGCLNAANGLTYCTPLGGVLVFASAQQCKQFLTTRLGPGEYANGRFHSAQAGSSRTWYECDQRPTSEWTPVQ